MERSKHEILTTGVLAILAWPQLSLGQGFDPAWRLQADIAFVDPSGDSVAVETGIGGVNVDFDPQVGAGLRGEYQFTGLLGIEAGVMGASGINVSVGDTGGTAGVATKVSSFSPLTIGLNFHFAKDSPVDLYAGPFFAIVSYGDVEVEAGTSGVGTRVSVDRDFTWGGVAGVGIPFGKSKWSFQSNVRYIDTSLEGADESDPFKSEFHPVIFSIGIGYRF